MKYAIIFAIGLAALSSPTFAQTLDTLEGVYRAEMGSKDSSAPLFVRITKDGAVLQISPPALAYSESDKEIPLEMRKNGTRFGGVTEKDGRFTINIPKQNLNLFVPSTSGHMSIEFGIRSAPVRRDKDSGDLKVGLFDPYHFVKVKPEDVKTADDFQKATGEALKGKRWVLQGGKQVDKEGKDYSDWASSLLGTGYSNESAYGKKPESFPKCAGIEFRPDGKASVLVEDTDTKELKELANVAYLIDAFQKHLVIEHPYVTEKDGQKTREYSRFCVDVSAVRTGDLVLKSTPVMTGRNDEPYQPVSSQYLFKASDAK